MAAFERIARTLSLVEGFTLMPVQVTGPDVSRALSAWLEARGTRVRVVEPRDEEGWRAIVASVLGEQGGAPAAPEVVHAVMVIGPRGTPPGLGAGLSIANQRRDTIVEGLGCPLLWCGPLEFLNYTWERAPDLWSIRGMMQRVLLEAKAPPESPLWGGVVAAGAPERLRETLRAAREQGDREVAARVTVQLAESLLAGGEYGEAAEVIDEAKSEAPLSGNASATLALLRARAAHALGDVETARQALIEAELARQAPASSSDRSFEAQAATARGNLELRVDAGKARASYEEAVSAATVSGDKRNEAVALADLGIALLALGEAEAGLTQLEAARTLASEVGDERSEARCLMHLGRAHAALYDSRAAAQCFEEALELVRGQGDRRGEARVLFHVAKTYLDAGDAEKAREDALRALVLARSVGDEGLVARAEEALAEARAASTG
jgi:tetratricopeptide (TPR) repeat protein